MTLRHATSSEAMIGRFLSVVGVAVSAHVALWKLLGLTAKERIQSLDAELLLFTVFDQIVRLKCLAFFKTYHYTVRFMFLRFFVQNKSRKVYASLLKTEMGRCC